MTRGRPERRDSGKIWPTAIAKEKRRLEYWPETLSLNGEEKKVTSS